MQDIKEKIKNLPQAPGVYFFYGEDKQLLYIGKATSLRSRVQSYFRGQHNRGEWIDRMISMIADVSYEETESVLEALILESNLIKKHQPKYNTLEKDDKSFAYFMVTKEDYPRIIIVRKTDIDKIQNAKSKNQNGKSKIEKLLDSNYKKPYTHIYGPYTSKFQMQIALKIMRRIFPFHALKQKSEKGCLDFQLGVCPGPYASAISQEDYKKNIRGIRMILEGKKKRLVSTLDKEMQAAAKKHEFEKAAQLRNQIFALNHIRDVALITRDFDMDESRITNHELSYRELEGRQEFSEKLMPNQLKPARIEAYDISNISGDHSVGSMVVFENGKPNKSHYRKFKIKTIEGSNDVGMMKEVLQRRFGNDWKMPDLIILDGGQGHVNMGAAVLEDLGLAVPMVGVAKGPTRKKLEVVFPTSSEFVMSLFGENIKTILEDSNLLKYITDEAHRFAITFHRHRRKKGMLD